MKKTITFDFNNMSSAMVKEGITAGELSEAMQKIPAVHAGVEARRPENTWRELPYNQQSIVQEIVALAQDIKKDFDAFVVLGIGGSALGARAIFTALCHLKHNELPKEKRGAPTFYVLDNVDPEGLSAVFDVIDVRKTCFHVISKSGNTVETAAQLMLVLEHLHAKLGESYKKNIVVTTDAVSGNLKQIADEQGLRSFIVPDGVGGRFSVLSPVGLLSAAVLGVDIITMLRGAAAMHERCMKPDAYENPAYMYAMLQYIAMKKGANISVMMPYADSLAHVADWYAQLWAESLGKRFDKEGNQVFTGQTPVRALGVTDQHSQVQLYTEGPFDKVITFLGVEAYRSILTIPEAPINVLGTDYLAGQTFNTLIAAEQVATEYAITKAGKMNMRITLSEVNAYTVGALFMFYEMATAAAGEFLQIDAFDQPGVEEGKIATFALMGRTGYEEKRVELSATKEKEETFIFEF